MRMLPLLASLLAACGPTVPRGDVGQGGAVRGLIEACVRLGASADTGTDKAIWLFNNVCAPFFGWPPVEGTADRTPTSVVVTAPVISPLLMEAVEDGR